MIRNGGGLIDVTLCDGFLYCASVFSKSIAKATFSFPYVLDPAFGALYHVHEVRRRAGDVMPYTFLLVSSEESVRRGSFFNKTARFTPSSVTTERSQCQAGDGLRCLALTSMSRRLLHRRYDMRGGEGNAAWQRCEERRILRLLEITWRMLGKAGLNVTTNGILLDSFLVDVWRALLRGIWRTLSISSLMKRYLYPLLIR